MDEQPESLVIELDKPISYNGGSYDRLELREPTVGEVSRALKKGPADLDIAMVLIVAVSGAPPAVVEKLPITVVARASDYLKGFTTPAGRGTGGS